jgi:FkbM family methyltransferase
MSYHRLDQDEINFAFFVQKQIKEDFVFFDVGTNRGLYIDLFARVKDIQIHGFEPIDKLYSRLQQRYDKYDNIIINQCVISDIQDRLDFFELEDDITDGCSSLVQRPVFDERGWKYSKIEVNSDTIDNYCQKYNIDHIDLLKIDVEGKELAVLKGSDIMLTDQRINYIQFEYGDTFLDAGTSLSELYKYIQEKGYRLYSFRENIFEEIDDDKVVQYSKIPIINFFIKKDGSR